jgi:hypothetical protein
MFSESYLKEVITASLLKKSHQAANFFIPPKERRPHNCTVDGCSRPAHAGDFCNAHYIRKRKGMPMDVPVRARKRADKCVECDADCGAKGGWGLCAKHYKKARQVTLKTALVTAMGGKCQKCSGVFPLCVYDFHHIGDKDESPSYLLANSSIEVIAGELSRCVLLCANCHRLEHHDI